MVELKNKIVDKIYLKWDKLINDPELKDTTIDDDDFDLRLTALCLEVFSCRCISLNEFDANFHVVILKFIRKKDKKYKTLINRMNYLYGIKEISNDDFDFMYELENLLTCFLEILDESWRRYINEILQFDNLHSLSYRNLMKNDPLYIYQFLTRFESEPELEFN